jgi:hypothetical protein
MRLVLPDASLADLLKNFRAGFSTPSILRSMSFAGLGIFGIYSA